MKCHVFVVIKAEKGYLFFRPCDKRTVIQRRVWSMSLGGGGVKGPFVARPSLPPVLLGRR